MNNSFFEIEQANLSGQDAVPETVIERMKEREGQLLRILEAIAEVRDSKGWSTLTVEVFGSLVQSLERKLMGEAKEGSPDTQKLSRLAGQLEWAERYADLDKLEGVFRQELSNIRLKYGKS